ncbi:MAG TPA: cytochrome c biogenesis protein ResB [Planctomycetota bacterium]|nr:cytochrome c biogenesis protein ResB [Planctomycetota bacterium]
MSAEASSTPKNPTALDSAGHAGVLRRVIDVCSSMRLTVVLLLMFGVLTFAGTLAQGKLGLFVTQRDYFESFFVIWDTEVPLGGGLTLKIPWVGGYAILLALFVNLVVGGVVRHRWTWRNGGILLAHLGIALLLVAGFVKLNYSYAGHVALFEGKATSTMASFHDYELALLRQDGDGLVERVVPATRLSAARGANTVTVTAPDLPFSIEVSNWLDNCRPRQKGPMVQTSMPVVTDADGSGFFLQEAKVEPERERNTAGCYVKVIERIGRQEHQAVLHGLDTRPFSEDRQPFTFQVDGATWGLDLRRVLWDLPFRLRLDKFQKADHPGTMTPRDFSSWVTVFDGDAERKVHIYMNHPLRSKEHVFFQTNWGPQPGSDMTGPPWYSVFEVSVNPSDDWPKYASYVVFAGLLVHFLQKLIRHLRSSTRRNALPELT